METWLDGTGFTATVAGDHIVVVALVCLDPRCSLAIAAHVGASIQVAESDAASGREARKPKVNLARHAAPVIIRRVAVVAFLPLRPDAVAARACRSGKSMIGHDNNQHQQPVSVASRHHRTACWSCDKQAALSRWSATS